jgi:signal transduction histidine kinase
MAFAAIAVIIVTAFTSYFYLQAITENNLKSALLEEQKQRQIDTTEALANHIASDIDSLILRLELLAASPSLQRGEFTSETTSQLLWEADVDISRITVTDSIRIADANGVLVNTSYEEYRRFMGLDRSQLEYVREVRSSLKPFVSSGYMGATGTFYVAIGVPIINATTGEYAGVVSSFLPTSKFFERYGNIYDADAQSIVALDSKGTILASGLSEVVGENIFGERIQELTQGNPTINQLYSNVLAGNADSALFTANLGERFSSGSPIIVNDRPVLYIFVTTPTASIYAQINAILQAQYIQNIVLLLAVVAAVSLLILYLARWTSTLEKRVSDRTQELHESNQKLIAHDKMQQEFINIAAHELRTPVQPLLGIADLLEMNTSRSERIEITRPELEMIIRNAKRLERLSSDILEVSRIESQSLKLHRERVDMNKKIQNVVIDAKSFVPSGRKLEIVAELYKEPLYVFADKPRLFEVVSNLVNNAVKFTGSGTITVRVEKEDDNAVVSVRDTGRGIDPDVMPRLFTKFVSKSVTGTGLGLFISKSIVEAHGGRIWAENNSDGRGATFTFSLPLQAHAEIENEGIKSEP